MTTSDHTKVLQQIKKKPGKYAKYKKHNTPRNRGKAHNKVKCSICGRSGAHVSKYGMSLCRQCFRDHALKLGFKKYT